MLSAAVLIGTLRVNDFFYEYSTLELSVVIVMLLFMFGGISCHYVHVLAAAGFKINSSKWQICHLKISLATY